MIKLEDVSKTFRRQLVLDGVDLAIERGERVAMVGSNGAGKTTLIRCLLGEYVHEGRVSIDDVDPRLARQDVLAKVGFVPQIPPPLKMPVGELVNFSASLCGTEITSIAKVSAKLGLDLNDVENQAFVKLSGGQKQKVLIAIALGRAAELLIMDEPAANLDPEARGAFFHLLAERQDNSVMLITSHRLDEVAALVNRVVELDRGKVVLDDRVADAIDLTGSLFCRITLSRVEPAFAKAIGDWKFSDMGEGRVWAGSIAGPDRLRFLGLLSRYAGLLSGVDLSEKPS
jgi:ABC-2 type transport system ATP-binding protein